MAVSNGINGQVTLGEESTWGTAVTPDRTYEFNDETFDINPERSESKGVRAGQRLLPTARWATGKIDVPGTLTQEVHNKGFGRLFKHLLGIVNTTGPNADGQYTHTFTIGDLTGKGLTGEVGWKDTASSPFNKTIAGMKAKGWELDSKLGEFLILKSDWIAKSMTLNTAVTTAAYVASTTPYFWTMASVTIGGVAVDMAECNFKVSNPVDDARYYLGSSNRKEPIENGWRLPTVTIDSDWIDWTTFTRVTAGTEAAVVLTYTGALIAGSSNYQLIVTANVRFDGNAPVINGLQRIKQPLIGRVTDPGSNSFKIDYKTTDTTP